MLTKNHLLKANKVYIIRFKFPVPNCVPKVPYHHKDVYISGLDADGDPYAVTLHNPSRSFRVPKEGDLWTLPEDEDFEVSQKRITWPRDRSSLQKERN